MKNALIALGAFLRPSIATMLQYRGEMALWAVWGVVYPAVAMAMWSAAVQGSRAGAIHGMDGRDFAAYFLLMMIVGHLTTAWDIFEMGYVVRTGAMSPKLLRPVLPIWHNLADNVAYKVVTLVMLVPIWAVIGLVSQPRISADATQLALGVVATLVACVLHFLWNYNLALGAFWLTRTEALAELWWGSNILFGGRMAPLTVMPLPLQWVAAVLPFQWIIWFPSAALAGQLEPGAILRGLGWQAAWLVFGIVFFRVAWRYAVRQYSAVGA
jgi:ABC-2 type transport system permease protein